MSNVFFTSDTHFGHARIIELSHRPFASVEEMNETIIERWNATVRPQDIVWHLGDVGMGRLGRFSDCLKQLNGTKHLITGNHDEVWPGDRDAYKHQRAWMEHFDTVQQYARRKINGLGVLLSHFPYKGDHSKIERYTPYRLQDTGSWLIHGHVHGEWMLNGRQINVGVDQWNFTPVHLDDLAALLPDRLAS